MNPRTIVRPLVRATARALGRLPGTSLAFGPPRGGVTTVADWLGRHPDGGALHPLSPARATGRRPPAHADPALAARIAGLRTGRVKPRFVAELHRARYVGFGYGCTVTPDDTILKDASLTFSDFDGSAPAPPRHDLLCRPRLPPLERVAGIAVALNTFAPANFHHWLLDTLPAFGLLREAGLDPAAAGAVLLQAGRPPFVRESLARLGLPADRVRTTDARTHLQADTLWVPSFSEPGRQPEQFDYTPEGLRFVRDLFLDGRTPPPVAAERIVISREQTASRRLRDGGRIHERLRREGFATVCLEDFTVAQQAALFAAARVIVLPTGGGLANLVFCRAGARVIELFHPAYLPAFCLPLTQALGLEYHGLVGAAGAGGAVHHDAGAAHDIDLPVERILEHLP